MLENPLDHKIKIKLKKTVKRILETYYDIKDPSKNLIIWFYVRRTVNFKRYALTCRPILNFLKIFFSTKSHQKNIQNA